MNGDNKKNLDKKISIIDNVVNFLKEKLDSKTSLDFDKDPRKKKKAQVLGMDLIKDEIVIYFDWRKNIVNLIIWMILAGFFVGGLYGGIVWWERQKTETIDYYVEAFNELNIKIKKTELRAENALLFKKKLALVNKVLGNHIYWTNFFDFLEHNTLVNIAYSDFSGDTNGKYQLTAMAKDFKAISSQVRAMLADPYTRSAKVDGSRVIQDDSSSANISAMFNLNIDIDPKIFVNYESDNNK